MAKKRIFAIWLHNHQPFISSIRDRLHDTIFNKKFVLAVHLQDDGVLGD